MHKRLSIIAFIIIVILLTSCQLAQQEIIEDKTKTPTKEMTLEPISSPTNTKIPTPSKEKMIIDKSLYFYLLTEEDLKKEGITDWEKLGPAGEYTNSEWISYATYYEEVDSVIHQAGRVTGWGVMIGEDLVSSYVYCKISIFKSISGAQSYVKYYNEVRWNEKYDYINNQNDIGDTSIYYSRHNNGIGIAFSYRNVVVEILSYDYGNINLLESLAKIEFEKLQNAPLVNPDEANFNKFEE